MFSDHEVQLCETTSANDNLEADDKVEDLAPVPRYFNQDEKLVQVYSE